MMVPTQNTILDLFFPDANHNNIPLTPYKIIPKRFAVKLYI